MALLVLSNDITNAHQIDGPGILALIPECHTIRRVGGHEAQAIWECSRTLLDGSESTFHVIASRPSFCHETMDDYEKRLRRAARERRAR